MRWALVLGVLLTVGVFSAWFFNRPQDRNAVGLARPAGTATASLVTKSDAGEGGVTVTARPVDVSEESVVFEFVMDTHSGDLTNFSVLEKVSLVLGERVVAPKEWQETANSGHHRAGRLVFEIRDIGEMGEIGEIELVIKDLGGVDERKIGWTL